MSTVITSPAALNSSDAKFQVLLPLGAANADVWCEVPGAAQIEVNNGERPINETETFSGTIIQSGEKTLPEISVDVPSLLPHMRIMREIVRKFEQRELINIRWHYPEREIQPLSQGANNTVDISTAGVASFGSGVPNANLLAYAGSRVPEGITLFVGTSPNIDDYIIENKVIASNGVLTSFSVVDAATLAPPTAAVSDEPFGFRVPRVDQPEIACEIMSAGNQTAAVSQAGLASNLVFRALHNLGPQEVVSN